jgi:hypothetical protein
MWWFNWLQKLNNWAAIFWVQSVQFYDCSDETMSGVSEVECNALKVFYESTNGDAWINNDNWLVPGTSVDSRYGVKEVLDWHITIVQLRDNNLTWQLSPVLSRLTHLRILDLAENQLFWTLPEEYWFFSEIEHLYLFNNQLSWEIPSTLATLPKIISLLLDRNYFCGQIPTRFMEEWSWYWDRSSRLNIYDNNLLNAESDYLSADWMRSRLVARNFVDETNNLIYRQIPQSCADWDNWQIWDSCLTDAECESWYCELEYVWSCKQNPVLWRELIYCKQNENNRSECENFYVETYPGSGETVQGCIWEEEVIWLCAEDTRCGWEFGECESWYCYGYEPAWCVNNPQAVDINYGLSWVRCQFEHLDKESCENDQSEVNGVKECIRLDTTPWYCKESVCGDGIVDPWEECDWAGPAQCEKDINRDIDIDIDQGWPAHWSRYICWQPWEKMECQCRIMPVHEPDPDIGVIDTTWFEREDPERTERPMDL